MPEPFPLSFHSPENRRGIVHGGTYWSLSPGSSMTYTVGATVFGIGISSQTIYDGTHTQKIEAGNHEGEHDI